VVKVTTDLERPSLEGKIEYKGIARWKNPEKDGEYGWATLEDTYTRGRLRETMTDVV